VKIMLVGANIVHRIECLQKVVHDIIYIFLLGQIE
jgi:hypothetical protein